MFSILTTTYEISN